MYKCPRLLLYSTPTTVAQHRQHLLPAGGLRCARHLFLLPPPAAERTSSGAPPPPSPAPSQHTQAPPELHHTGRRRARQGRLKAHGIGPNVSGRHIHPKPPQPPLPLPSPPPPPAPSPRTRCSGSLQARQTRRKGPRSAPTAAAPCPATPRLGSGRAGAAGPDSWRRASSLLMVACRPHPPATPCGQSRRAQAARGSRFGVLLAWLKHAWRL